MADWFISPALVQLRKEINVLWPHRDKTSDGAIGDPSHQARASDHNPDWDDGGIVRAIDIDEDLVIGLTAVGEAMPLVNQIIRDERTRYVIYEGRIWTRENGWRPYYGVNAHRHHIHVSVRSVGNYDRDARPWGIVRSTSSVPGGSIPSPAKDWFDMASLTDLTKALNGVIDTPAYRTMISNTVWKWTQIQVPGTERTESPERFLQEIRVLGVQAVTESRLAVQLVRALLDGQTPTPEEVAALADTIAKQVAEEVKNIKAEEVAGLLDVTVGVKDAE